MENNLSEKPFTGYEQVSNRDLYDKLEQMNADNMHWANGVRLGIKSQEDFEFFNHQVQVESQNIGTELQRRGLIK